MYLRDTTQSPYYTYISQFQLSHFEIEIKIYKLLEFSVVVFF